MARAAGFGHLVVAGPDRLASTPVPFLISDDGAQVRAHLARPNMIWKLAPCDALLIVPLGDAYISPGWYPSKAEHGKVVPTWNYEVVHLHGRLVAHDDAAWTSTMVSDLTDLNESELPLAVVGLRCARRLHRSADARHCRDRTRGGHDRGQTQAQPEQVGRRRGRHDRRSGRFTGRPIDAPEPPVRGSRLTLRRYGWTGWQKGRRAYLLAISR